MEEDRVSALRTAINGTLTAIEEGQAQVHSIVESTQGELQRLETEYEWTQNECTAAIDKVEALDRESRTAKERLLVVNRDIGRYSELEMKKAYDTAQNLQLELGQWREREAQLRFRRDDLARRLKRLRATVHQAEILTAKFTQAASFLTTEFEELSETLQEVHAGSLLGLQMLQVQEDERRWIAQQLHDGPMQSLASIAMRLQASDTHRDSAAIKQDLRVRMNHVIGDLRQMVFDLRPPLLDDLGLVPTLKRYASQWEQTNGIAVTVRLIGVEATLSPTEKVTAFRTVQEALRNVIQHAQAGSVQIILTYAEQSLHICVVDNGVGYPSADWVAWVEDGKLGLTLCRQRLKILGGTLELESSGGLGTGLSVCMLLPLVRGRAIDSVTTDSNRDRG